MPFLAWTRPGGSFARKWGRAPTFSDPSAFTEGPIVEHKLADGERFNGFCGSGLDLVAPSGATPIAEEGVRGNPRAGGFPRVRVAPRSGATFKSFSKGTIASSRPIGSSSYR